MRFDVLDSRAVDLPDERRSPVRPGGGSDGSGSAVTIRPLSAEGGRWRVLVESWEVPGGCEGRLIFQPEGPIARADARVGPVNLRGAGRTELVGAAHELPEAWLRGLLHSLA